MTAPSQALRKLAEEIAEECVSGPDYEVDVEGIEARLRSALPSLSQLLGELAVAQGRLDELADLADESYEQAGREASKRRWAHDSDFARLAAELIRAAVKQLLLCDRLETAQSEEEASELGQQCNEASEQEVQACFALLQAFPGIREEVERG